MERDCLGDLGVDGIIIIKCMYWGHLAEYRNKWRAFVNTVVKL
jgi:hypothetical protein